MKHPETTETVRCPIGVRETVSADGPTRRRLLVHCHPQREAVELMDCGACGRRLFVRMPSAESSGWVQCLRAEGDAGAPPERTGLRAPVRLVMDRDVTCVRPDVTVDAAALMLLGRHAESAPVVDESGHPVGVVALADVMRGPDAEGGRTVAEVMTPLVFTVFENTELARAAQVMSTAGVGQLPVLRGDGSLAGLLSPGCVARWAAGASRRG